MKEKDRSLFDDILYSKFKDFEAETHPEDWDRIASRLPESDSISPLRTRWPYWAAAVISLLLVMGGGVYLSRRNAADTLIAKRIETETHTLRHKSAPAVTRAKRPVTLAVARHTQTPPPPAYADSGIPAAPEDTAKEIVKEKIYLPRKRPVREEITEEINRPDNASKAAKPARKWSFGMGAGGLTEGSGNTVNTYLLRSNSYSEDEKLLSMNALSDEAQGKEPKTNIKYRTPVSVGFSVSRQLSGRFSLQTGLTYSFLASDWETQASTYNKEINQRLHFIGIPLSLTCKIADWGRLRFYASAGMQVEVNVAGRERTKSFFAGQQTGVSIMQVRMKEWQWSANARIGASYPLLRFISVYAEAGAAYYFKNGSLIETVYSNKAFNINPQAGIRLAF
jgi:hypothetical protein